MSFKGSTDSFVENTGKEGHRASLILYPAALEAILLELLSALLVNLNKDEKDRFFAHEGLAGTFSRKIQLAQALGIIDRTTRNRLDQMREIRNAAAHALVPLNFDTPAIEAAILAFYPAKLRKSKFENKVGTLDLLFKVAFIVLLIRIASFQKVKTNVDNDFIAFLKEWARASQEEGDTYQVAPWIEQYYNTDEALN